MAARATMSDLIDRVRGLIGDNGATETLTDEEIESLLDQRRTDAVHAPLAYARSISTSGAVEYHDYYGRDAGAVLPWESSPVLQDSTGATLTPDTSAPMRGYWYFTASQTPPVYITGAFFDIYGAAALACRELAGRVAQEFDYGTDGHDFTRSQKHANLLTQAVAYERRAVPPGARQTSMVGA